MPIIAADPEAPPAAPKPAPLSPVQQLAVSIPDAAAAFVGHGTFTACKVDALAILDHKLRAIDTDEQHVGLGDLILRAKAILKDVEDLRKKVTEPIKKQAAAVDGEARRWREPVEKWVKDAERAFTAYLQVREARRIAQEAEARKQLESAAQAHGAAIEAGNAETIEETSKAIMHAELAMPSPEPIRGVKTDAGTLSTREVWAFRVVDPAKVPRQFLAVDEAAIRKAVQAGARTIEGVAIFLEQQVAGRTR